MISGFPQYPRTPGTETAFPVTTRAIITAHNYYNYSPVLYIVLLFILGKGKYSSIYSSIKGLQFPVLRGKYGVVLGAETGRG